jgi:hypothetical protein
MAHRRTLRRMDAKVFAAVAVVMAAAAVLIVVGPLHSGTGPTHSPTAAEPASTTAPAATSTTTTVPVAASSQLNTYVADETQTDSAALTASSLAARLGSSPFVSVHSAPVVDDGHTIAVAAFSYDPGGHPVQVLEYSNGNWMTLAALPAPTGQFGIFPSTYVSLTTDPVSVADVTGDGRPDFLITGSAADNVPGFVVSQDGGLWRYIPFSGPYVTPPKDVIGGSPQFLGDSLVSDYDNCIPDCAQGQNSAITWTYDSSTGDFTAPDPPGHTGSAVTTTTTAPATTADSGRASQALTPTNCQTGPISVAVSLAVSPLPVCLYSGSTLTVTFNSSIGGLGVPGPWGDPPVQIEDPSVVRLTSSSTNGRRLTAVLATGMPGTTTVFAMFDEECATGEATPCTIPPGSPPIDVNVTVKS